MSGVEVATGPHLGATREAGVRALLEAAFGGDFSEEDWRHALGGVHAWIEVRGEVVAHASVVRRTLWAGERALRVGYVEAVAVLPGHQGQGLGSRAMVRVGELIRARYELGALSTGEWAFYERLGWERWRGSTFARLPGGRVATPEDDGGIMILRTPRTPVLDLDEPICCDWRAGDLW